LKISSEILFAEFTETFQLKKIYSTFDACKQPKGVCDEIHVWFVHLRKQFVW